jgi:hypothetical protein
VVANRPECQPTFATPRSPERKTLGGAVAKVSKTLGKELMPWQRMVADVAGEIDPETGRLVYSDIIVTVPRQSGKSTLILPEVVTRSELSRHLGGPQQMLYLAQTRGKARKKWEEEYLDKGIRKCRALDGKYTVKLTTGNEHITFRDGSVFGIDASTEDAAHGDSLDFACKDEAWADADDRVDQAIQPTMLTRPSPQFWIVSTAGNDASVYLDSKVKLGRAAVRNDTRRGIAYFEWSADPEAPIGDPDTWWSCMPALGYTTTEAAVRSRWDSMGDKPAEFARAYLNVWSRDVVHTVIPLALWRACADPAGAIVGAPVLAVDVSPDRSTATIVACGPSAGRTRLEVVPSDDSGALRRGDGIEWVLPRLLELISRHGPRALVLDDAGPAGTLVQGLKGAGHVVRSATDPEGLIVLPGTHGVVDSCGLLVDIVNDATLSLPADDAHPGGDPVLEGALRVASKRPLGDAWAWRRLTSTGDITAIVAASLAAWGHRMSPVRAPKRASKVW